MRVKDIAGQKFGMLTVLSFAGVSPGRARLAIWNCRCDCGIEKTFYGTALRNGTTSSCGCNRKESISKAVKRHGMTHSTEYNVWKGMLARCCNPKDPFYDTYGGRGIAVCESWKNSFENFLADMGMRPPDTSLDRIDNESGYSKDNCRWASKEVQALNRRTTIKLELGGEIMSRKEAARRIGIHVNALRRWMLMGFTPDEVMLRKSGGSSTVEGSLCA